MKRTQSTKRDFASNVREGKALEGINSLIYGSGRGLGTSSSSKHHHAWVGRSVVVKRNVTGSIPEVQQQAHSHDNLHREAHRMFPSIQQMLINKHPLLEINLCKLPDRALEWLVDRRDARCERV